MAIIGSDRYSIEWLKVNLPELKRLSALIMVTEVPDKNVYQALVKSLAPLEVSLFKADVLLEDAEIKTYPNLTNESRSLSVGLNYELLVFVSVVSLNRLRFREGLFKWLQRRR